VTFMKPPSDGSDETENEAVDEVVTSANLVSVYRAPRMQAEIIRSVLEGSGIQAFVRGSGMSGAYPGGVLDDSGVMVRKEDEVSARELLADYES
jgi:putative signal transducing protein